MKRSEINTLLRQAKALFREHRFALPPFAEWTPEHWQGLGAEADEISHCGLGWDLTDFGGGDFHRTGLLLFTGRISESCKKAGLQDSLRAKCGHAMANCSSGT